jgi:hypothetical protein
MGPIHPATQRPDREILVPDGPATNEDLGVVKGAYPNGLAETRQAGVELARHASVAHLGPF